MKIDGPIYENPVVLSKLAPSTAYISLLSTLPEYRFRNRIVGFTDQAVYACSKRVARSGFYEMHCDPIPWSEAQDASYGRFFSIGSVVLGIALIALGAVLFHAGWVAQTHTGTAILWMPFAAPIAGLAFILGSRRLRLIVRTGDRKLYWVASPLFEYEAELLDRLTRIPGNLMNQSVDS